MRLCCSHCTQLSGLLFLRCWNFNLVNKDFFLLIAGQHFVYYSSVKCQTLIAASKLDQERR